MGSYTVLGVGSWKRKRFRSGEISLNTIKREKERKIYTQIKAKTLRANHADYSIRDSSYYQVNAKWIQRGAMPSAFDDYLNPLLNGSENRHVNKNKYNQPTCQPKHDVQASASTQRALGFQVS